MVAHDVAQRGINAADEAPEWHIVSLVVHVAPRRLAGAVDAIARLPGACMHGSAPNGKLVVTLEAASAAELLDRVAQVRAIRGVLTASLVYQCADTLQAMNEVMPDGDRTTGLH